MVIAETTVDSNQAQQTVATSQATDRTVEVGAADLKAGKPRAWAIGAALINIRQQVMPSAPEAISHEFDVDLLSWLLQ